jgi:lipopolysaccharide heptosyltransferase I
MHIAAAVGTDVLAIFGPTIPERTGPYGSGHRVITSGAPCAPCLKKECADPKLDMRCMKEITVEDVLHTAEEMLEGKDDKQGTA